MGLPGEDAHFSGILWSKRCIEVTLLGRASSSQVELWTEEIFSVRTRH
jgi:hypothetical protein